ncbi:MAG: OmpA family protein [Polyangiaceae bacterium]|nr:OmpA family protein [Polyangiaceae bacterium]
MRRFASTMILAAGLAVQSCSGAQPAAVDPSTDSGREEAEPEAMAETGDGEPLTESPPLGGEASEVTENPEARSDVVQVNEEGAGECRESKAKLRLFIDRKLVSIEDGRLQAEMDGPICQIMMKITLKDGVTAVEKAFRYAGPQREMRWEPVPRDEIEKIEIRVAAEDGAYESVFLVPWSVRIEHKEVEFDTNQALVRPSEVPSLEDSYAKINVVLEKVKEKQLGKVALFIVGHTDTRGSDEHNMTLSRNRARAIAAWFLKRGLCIPIAYEGFGETALKRMTADEVDAQENRRADYILAVEPPVVTSRGRAPVWQWISQGC